MMVTSAWFVLVPFMGLVQHVGTAPSKLDQSDAETSLFKNSIDTSTWLTNEVAHLIRQSSGNSERKQSNPSDVNDILEWKSDSIIRQSRSEVQNDLSDSDSELLILKQKRNTFYTGISSLVRNAYRSVETVAKRRVRDIFSDLVGGAVTCDACKALISLIQYLASSNTTTEEIKSSVYSLCTNFNIQTPRVCKGLVDEFAPEILTVMIQLMLSPDEFCATMFDDCGEPHNPLDDWNVTFPTTPQPPPVHPVLPKKGSPTLRILHLTDVHFDPEYRAGSNAKCGEPLCCRDNSLVNGPDAAGKYGDYRNCDTPLWTLENMFATLAAQNDTFDYIIWTGDVPAHNIWNQSRADQISVLNNVVSLILKYFPGKAVYPSLGNHESSPVNSFPPPYITDENAITWLYQALADGWKNWLPQDALDSVIRGAFYTVSPHPGLRIISLNMNYCNNQNWWMLLNRTDPAGELQWLISTLQKAEDIGEKVHILGHIPPGVGDCLKSWSWNYYKIVSRYQNTISGQFFGHTHKDEFEVFYDVETLKTPVSVAYIAPSVTTFSNLNMGYRFYTIDGAYKNSSYQVLDHETFYLNLTKANTEDKLTWEFEYSAKSTYNLPSVFPRDWNDLINSMKTNSTLLQTYNKFLTKSVSSGACDADCWSRLLCKARSGRSHDPSLCKDFIKRDEDFEIMLLTERKHC